METAHDEIVDSEALDFWLPVVGSHPAAFSGSPNGTSSANHGHARHARRYDDDRRETTAARAPEVRRRDQRDGQGFQTVLATVRRAAQGRAKRVADHDR